MRKKELALAVIERLKKEYPDAACSLDYDEAWKLLVSVRLAAQCTDARVNIVVDKLYECFPDVAALAAAPVEEIEKIVHPCGLGNSKARDISACMKMLQDEYEGKVPDDFDALLKLPGVGRKSANLIMGDVFGKPAIVTDTHCIRLCNRIGLWMALRNPRRWRWHCGRLFRRRKEATSATDWSGTAGRSVLPGPGLIATSAVCRISAKRIYKIKRILHRKPVRDSLLFSPAISAFRIDQVRGMLKGLLFWVAFREESL